MSIIGRYIFRSTNLAIIIVVGCLLSLTTLFALFEELNQSDSGYGIVQVIEYLAGTTPKRLNELLIYSVFLGLLVSLGRLAESNELTVLRSSGMSPTRLLRSLIPTLILWILLSACISEYIIPQSEKRAEIHKLQVVHGENGLEGKGGMWFKDEGLYMQITAFGNKSDLFGITQYWLDGDQQLHKIISAKSATYDPVLNSWTLTKTKETLFLKNQTITTKDRAKQSWDNPITPSRLASQAFIEPKKMSISDLYLQINFIEQQGINNNQYNLAFWSRLLQPLAYLSLSLYAIAVLLGPLRQTSAGFRISVGIFSGLGFMYLKNLFIPMVNVFGLPAIVAVIAPIALLWLISAILIRKNA